jgi:O-antigen/teichoic acid export membrane protein
MTTGMHQSDDPFATNVVDAQLRQRSVNGGAYTVTAQLLRYAIDVMSIVVLARLLRPEEFGLIAMVAVVLGIATVFRDAGLGMATIQREQIREDEVSALFWINGLVGALLAIGVAALGPSVAWFYGDERLAWITMALGSSLFFAGLETQHAALLRRQMRFRALAWIQTSAQLLGAVAAITAAAAGFGVGALVIRGVVFPAVSLLGVFVAMPWRPLPPWRSRGTRSLLRFGGYVTAFGAVNHVGRNLDNLLIGRFFGGASLGLYTKAYSLLMLPVQMINSPISAVALPALSQLRSNPERMRAYYSRALTMVVSLSMPVVAWLAAISDSFVITVLGEQWIEVSRIFQILAIPAFIGTLNVSTGWVFLSLGRVREQLLSGTINTIGVSIAIIIGLQWGVHGVAWALVASAVIQRPPTIAYCYHGTPFKLRDLCEVLWRPAAAALIAGALTHLAHEWLVHQAAPPVVVLISAPLYGALYICALWGSPGGHRVVTEIWGNFQTLRNRPAEVPA